MTTAFITLLLAGAWTDLRTRRIPNDLTVAGLFIGLAIRGVVAIQIGSVLPVLSGIGGAAIGLLALFPLFAVRAMGGGDVKLTVAAGAFLGVERVVLALLFSAIAGGVMGLVAAIRRGVLLPVLLGARDLMLYGISFGKMGSKPVHAAVASVTIPYGLAIAIGSLGCWLL